MQRFLTLRTLRPCVSALRAPLLKTVYNTIKSVLNLFFAKIDDKAEFQAGQTQIGEYLRLENIIVLGCGFGFHNHQSAN